MSAGAPKRPDVRFFDGFLFVDGMKILLPKRSEKDVACAKISLPKLKNKHIVSSVIAKTEYINDKNIDVQSNKSIILCQHCKYRENRKKHECSGFCSALKIWVMRKDKRASTCVQFKRRQIQSKADNHEGKNH